MKEISIKILKIQYEQHIQGQFFQFLGRFWRTQNAAAIMWFVLITTRSTQKVRLGFS